MRRLVTGAPVGGGGRARRRRSVGWPGSAVGVVVAMVALALLSPGASAMFRPHRENSGMRGVEMTQLERKFGFGTAPAPNILMSPSGVYQAGAMSSPGPGGPRIPSRLEIEKEEAKYYVMEQYGLKNPREITELGDGTFGYVFGIPPLKADGDGLEITPARAIKVSRYAGNVPTEELAEECQHYYELCNFHVVCNAGMKRSFQKPVLPEVYQFKTHRGAGQPYGLCSMEMADKTLYEFHKGRKLPYALVTEILKQLLLGLESLNSRSFIHNDLKPNNVFVFTNRLGVDRHLFKLGDLGRVTKLTTERGSRVSQTPNAHPKYLHPIIGRTLKMLKEKTAMAQGEGPGDLFALAVMGIELVIGSMEPYVPTVNGARGYEEFYASNLLNHVRFEEWLREVVNTNTAAAPDVGTEEELTALIAIFKNLIIPDPLSGGRVDGATQVLERHYMARQCGNTEGARDEKEKQVAGLAEVVTLRTYRHNDAAEEMHPPAYSCFIKEGGGRFPVVVRRMCQVLANQQVREQIVELGVLEDPWFLAKYIVPPDAPDDPDALVSKYYSRFLPHVLRADAGSMPQLPIKSSTTAVDVYAEWRATGSAVE